MPTNASFDEMSKRTQPVKPEAVATERDARAPYEAPRLLKKRSVSRVTLFLGSGATGTGVTGP